MLVSKEILQKVINEASQTGADFVEVFVEDTISSSIGVLDGKVERLNESRIRGVGLRLAIGYNYVYGYTNEIDEESMIKLAKELREKFDEPKKEVTPLKDLVKGEHHKAKILFNEVDNKDKIEVLMKAYNAAREYDPLINQASSSLTESIQRVLIAKMDGRLVEDERVYSRLVVSAIAKEANNMEDGYISVGKAKGYELIGEIDPVSMGSEASRQAINNLHAINCPSGEMPVIIENAFGGVLFHEAVSHSLEATSVGKGLSVFKDMIGQRVANDCVTAYDDGTIENEWGSESYDDEGTPQERRCLIKNGILVSYMVDELNARRMKCDKTGSSRRQSYKYAPTSRMSNTFIENGKDSLDDMLKDIKLGLYCKLLGGGSVNPTTGDFNFAVNEGYLIEDGKITKPVKGVSLVGSGKETLRNIVMVGDNKELSCGICGSESGSVPVTVGQPRIKVSKMTVGGRGE